MASFVRNTKYELRNTRQVATPAELKERWEKKKNQIETLSNNINRLRRDVAEDIKSDEEKKFLTALAVAIIDKTGERVGNNASAEKGNFGVTGLRKKHIKTLGDTITLTYRGKSGVEHENVFTSSKLSSALKRAIKNSKGIRVFQTSDGFRVKNDGVNRYLDAYGISAKDIRGFRSNDWIIKGLSKNEIPENESARRKIFLSVLKKVAEKIGHGKSTLRTHYMIPALETSYINDGKIIDISNKETYENGGLIKIVSDGSKGGLLYGETDKGSGKGIAGEVIGGKKVVLGGGEIIINEEAAKKNCEELNRINTSTGGRAIDCSKQASANTTNMEHKHSLEEFNELISRLDKEIRRAINENNSAELSKLFKLKREVVDQKNDMHFPLMREYRKGGRTKEHQEEGIEIQEKNVNPIVINPLNFEPLPVENKMIELRKKAFKFLNENFLKSHIHIIKQNIDVFFNGIGVDKLVHAGGETKYKALFQIKEIIETSIFSHTEPDKKERADILKVWIFKNLVQWNGSNYEYRIYIDEKTDGHFVYSGNLDIKKPL